MRLEIEKMIYGGAALARHEGRAVFVEGALPGEQVEARVIRQKPGFAEARAEQWLRSSPERVQPGCPYFDACGGCQYQHAAYTAQLAIKRAILEETLTRAGLREMPQIAVRAAEPWGYRNRIRLHVDPATGAPGYMRPSSRQVLAVADCPIAAPVLQQALKVMRALLPAQAAAEWCEQVELFSNHDGSEVLLSLEGSSRPREAEQRLQLLCAALAEAVPQLAGAQWSQAMPAPQRNRRQPRTPQAQKPVAQWGAGALLYRAAGHTFRVSAGSFFQANRMLVDTLAVEAAGNETGSLAWDLFAGVGLFSRLLAERFARVVAVEGSPVSSADLGHNLPGHAVHARSTLAFLQRPGDRPDMVVLDPPRAGLGSPATEALAAIRSRSVTYVSCDPATLGRDLAQMIHAGYTLNALTLVDMFPQTFHLETVARLRLR